MPARSQAQRRFLNATKGHAWVKRHHFANRGKLPKRAKKR
jgi:transposase